MLIVVQYEQFFEDADGANIPSAVGEALDVLRGVAGARVVGSYVAKDDEKFRAKAVDAITIRSPITLQID